MHDFFADFHNLEENNERRISCYVEYTHNMYSRGANRLNRAGANFLPVPVTGRNRNPVFNRKIPENFDIFPKTGNRNQVLVF